MMPNIEKNRKWWVLAAMTTTISMIFVDVTVLPVVLPTLQRELGFSDLGLQWIVNIYTLVLAVVLLAGGRLGDIWGLRKSYIFGLICFAVASALCGLSRTEWWMIVSRGLQGIGGAFLIPATLGILASHFAPHERGKANGLYISVGSIFLSLGPLIGGTLTSYLGWYYVFWINLPIATVGLIMTLLIVPPMKGRKEPFDIRGFLILAIGLSSFITGLMQAQNWGWLSLPTLLLLGIGALFLYFLFHRKHKKHASLIDFEVLKKKTYIASASSIFCIQLVMMVTVFWAIYFQNILGFSPKMAGLLSFVSNIPILFAAPIAGYLVDRFGPRIPVMIGFSLITISLSWFLTFYHHDDFLFLIPNLLLFGFGIPLIITPSYVSVLNDTPAEKRGTMTGMTSSLRQLGATVGLALFGTIYASIYLSKLGKFLLANPSTASLNPKEFEGLLSKSPESIDALDHLNTANAAYVVEKAREAFLEAFSFMNMFAAIVALFSIVIARRLLKNYPVHKEK